MKNTWLIAIVGTVLAGGVACNRNRPAVNAGPNTSQLAALESAYRAGVFSRQEYETKKAALAAPAATPALQDPPAPAAPAIPTPVAPAPALPATASPAPAAPAAAPTAVASVNRKDKAVRRAAAPATPEPAVIAAPAPVTTPERVRTAVATPPPAPQEADDDPADRPAPVNGCRDITHGKEKGKQDRFYPMALDKVRDAAVDALQAMDFKVRKNSDNEIEASRKRHIGLIGSGGERLYLRFEEVRQGGQRGTRVTGETKKNLVLRAGQKSWTNAVLEQTACMLHNGI